MAEVRFPPITAHTSIFEPACTCTPAAREQRFATRPAQYCRRTSPQVANHITSTEHTYTPIHITIDNGEEDNHRAILSTKFDQVSSGPSHASGRLTSPGRPPKGWTPAYPAIDCNPWGEFKSIAVRFSPWMSFETRQLIAGMHRDAYRISKLALRSLDWMAKLDDASRSYYWSWGASGLEPIWWYPEIISAERASLAFWFGPYSISSFNQIRGTFQRHVALFESGKPYYKETFLCAPGSAIAQHLAGDTVRLCPHFFDSGTCFNSECTHEQWKMKRTTTLFHEWMHRLRPVSDLRDVKAPSLCSELTNGRCYRDKSFEHEWRFFGGDPRTLVTHGRFSEARSNIDNYVSWAFSRFLSAQWNFCNGPIAVSGPGKPAHK